MKISNNRFSERFGQLGEVIIREFTEISTSYAIILVLIGGIFVYGFLYNLMYAPNIVTDAPVVVVDRSNSKISREFTHWLDATSQIKVYSHALNMVEAKKLMKEGKVKGILFLPENFESQIYRGEGIDFPFYITTDAFLYYEALQKASANVMLAINEKYRNVEALFVSPQTLLAATSTQPINTVGTALYNPTQGYGSYLIPAVLMIILFQTLGIKISMLSGNEYQRKSLRIYTVYGKGWGTAARLVAGKTFTYSCIYAIFAYFFFIILPMLFSLPDIGAKLDIVIIMIPFLIGTCFFQLALSKWYKDAEAPLLLIPVFSVPFIFLSGVSYPLENMPWYWQGAHYLFPGTAATLAYVKINSMGASLADVRQEYITLWAQVVVYFALSVVVYRQKILSPRLKKA